MKYSIVLIVFCSLFFGGCMEIIENVATRAVATGSVVFSKKVIFEKTAGTAFYNKVKIAGTVKYTSASIQGADFINMKFVLFKFRLLDRNGKEVGLVFDKIVLTDGTIESVESGKTYCFVLVNEAPSNQSNAAVSAEYAGIGGGHIVNESGDPVRIK